MKELASQLTDRKLRFDGVSEVEPDQLARFLLLGVPPSLLRVTEETEDVVKFNEQVSAEEQVKAVQREPVQLDMSWQLPEDYQQLDLADYILTKFEERLPELGYSEELLAIAAARIEHELEEVERRGMIEFMRTVIFIIDEMRRTGVIWGVGRGSSCASYLLFLIGLHVVDCVTMDIPAEEFYHD